MQYICNDMCKLITLYYNAPDGCFYVDHLTHTNKYIDTYSSP